MKFESSKSIRKIRIENDYSQDYLAFKLGISQKSYSDIENGKTKIKQQYIEKLCEIYSVKPDYFCSLSCQCSANDKLKDILEYLNKKNIKLPEDFDF